jgi:hypothetical protein
MIGSVVDLQANLPCTQQIADRFLIVATQEMCATERLEDPPFLAPSLPTKNCFLRSET